MQMPKELDIQLVSLWAMQQLLPILLTCTLERTLPSKQCWRLNPGSCTCYTPGTPYKVSCSPTSGAVPPYSSSPNPYQTAVYPVRSAYPQQSPYAQQGTYYTQPLYAAPPHVIHHTTVVQPNGMPATVYPAPIPPPRGSGVTMGMVAGTTMAMSAGTLLTAHSPTPVAPHPVTVPTYRAPGTPTYSYVPPQW
ncbi:rCG22336, isoform CRA_a [Rattus norvegicus]|uniref:RCG22336, isoform CRA_a n=1 Tax=Rattus norvegicus TaxID=10116 RepID=A6INB1_RAT|nr:rCG22336, isoform CRA_a [Rattus norvegicus]